MPSKDATSAPSATEDVDKDILQILLNAKGTPLTIPQIEEQLGDKEIDTYDVRDAVWRLIANQKAEFTPRRHVKAVEEQS